MSKMIRIFLWLLALIVLLHGSGCGDAFKTTVARAQPVNDSQAETEPRENTASSDQSLEVPGLPNGFNIGNISVGFTKIERDQGRISLWPVFRLIKVPDSPFGWPELTVVITDDRGNGYRNSLAYHFAGLGEESASEFLGFTWIPDNPCIIGVPDIAPISEFKLNIRWRFPDDPLRETLPQSMDIDSERLTPTPDFGFQPSPESVLTGREIEQSRDVSIWYGEPRMREDSDPQSGEQHENIHRYSMLPISEPQSGEQQTIVISIPVVAENRDYSSRSTDRVILRLCVQLDSGRVVSSVSREIGSRQLDALSKIDFEVTFDITVERDEHARMAWVYTPTDIWGHRSKWWGFVPLSSE